MQRLLETHPEISKRQASLKMLELGFKGRLPGEPMNKSVRWRLRLEHATLHDPALGAPAPATQPAAPPRLAGEGEGEGEGGGGGEGGTASAAPVAVRKQSTEKRKCEEGTGISRARLWFISKKS